MNDKLNSELQRAADAQADRPLPAPGDNQVYYIYTEQLHQKASQALQEKEDWESIQQGLREREQGLGKPLEQVDAEIRAEFGFPPKV
jgi:hypothetical protein